MWLSVSWLALSLQLQLSWLPFLAASAQAITVIFWPSPDSFSLVRSRISSAQKSAFGEGSGRSVFIHLTLLRVASPSSDGMFFRLFNSVSMPFPHPSAGQSLISNTPGQGVGFGFAFAVEYKVNPARKNTISDCFIWISSNCCKQK